ncbi:hypothetical protein Hanom_Chr07g00627061 [Helianthus anomalus]
MNRPSLSRCLRNIAPSPISSQPLILSTVQKPTSISSLQTTEQTTVLVHLGVKYPMDLPAVREEIKSFYSEDDPQRRNLPSLQGYPLPKNIDEYLQLKAKQAEDISNKDKKGKSEKEIQTNLQYLLSQVRTLEQFSKDLCQRLSEKDDESLKQDYIEHIMENKKYKAERYQFKDWTISELKQEIERVQKNA